MSTDTNDQSLADRALTRIERTGNALPDPVTIFFIFIALVMVASRLVSTAGVSVVHPGTDETITAQNLFADENVRRLFTDMAETFADFPPLVLVVMLGIGVADKTGLISAALKSFVSSVPDVLLTAALIFAGIISSLAVDAGYVVVIPLGAVLFYGVGAPRLRDWRCLRERICRIERQPAAHLPRPAARQLHRTGRNSSTRPTACR